MKSETLETVIRHLKGIVAALEKEKISIEILDYKDMGNIDNEWVSVWTLSNGEYLVVKSPLHFTAKDRCNKELMELKLKGVSDEAYARFDRVLFDRRKSAGLNY